MRLSPLALALSLALLGACQQTAPRTDAVATQGDATAEHPIVAGPVVIEPEAAHSAVAESAALGSAVAADSAAKSHRVQQQAVVSQQESLFASAMPPMPGMPAGPPPPSPPPYAMAQRRAHPMLVRPQANTENYEQRVDNPLQLTSENPVSTFSIDVDTGSYSNVRRLLLAGQRPPADAVRVEEMLNYFDHGYPAPNNRSVPFKVSTEIAAAPWNPRRQLVQIGIQGYRVSHAELPPANLVFLIDTSGSMQPADRLPLVKQSLRELVPRLRAQDRVSIVVYAGSAGLVLEPTAGDQHATILSALDRLEAGGSTNGGQGLQLAYAMARSSFIGNGVNRVVLATDGDFNVGIVDQKALETLIADQRKSSVALTTLGFGAGNYNDAMAERLADIGNGNHAYVDSVNEARKVLVDELSSTMLTIAHDVKIQVEFNPALVAEYRLIGYENRALRREDFNNDKVDAGEIGAGHDVTALYEITLVGSGGQGVDPLRYAPRVAATNVSADELGWLRLRYKVPGSETSRLIQTPLSHQQIQRTPSPRLRWAAAVAAYADRLRGGSHVGAFGWSDIRALAANAGGDDRWGHRAEFLTLLDRARELTGDAHPVAVSE